MKNNPETRFVNSFTRFLVLSVPTLLLAMAGIAPAAPNEPVSGNTTATNDVYDGEVCTIGGCSIGHHAIPPLGADRYQQLLKQFADEPISSSSDAFEKLLYYGPQTRSHINRSGTPHLDERRANALITELSRTHAKVSVKIIDDSGTKRVSIDQKSVPLGESKHFPMRQTSNIRPPELSGTVYRVGVRHLWARY